MAFLNAGANAIEPDVNVHEGTTDQLCIDHGPMTGGKGDSSAPTLDKYLQDLHELAKADSRLALVYFDIKSDAQTPELVSQLRKAVRETLNTEEVSLNIIFSIDEIPDQDGTDPFQEIAGDLHFNEALMIDSENDPVAVKDFFNKHTNLTNYCYSNGILVGFTSSEATHIRGSIQQAANTMRASFHFIGVWTVNIEQDQKNYIGWGVDGMIVDSSFKIMNRSGDPGIENLVPLVNAHYGGIRLATRQDPAFEHSGEIMTEITLTGSGNIMLTYGQDFVPASLPIKAGCGQKDPVNPPGTWEYILNGAKIPRDSGTALHAGGYELIINFHPADAWHYYTPPSFSSEVHVEKANPKMAANGGQFTFDGNPHSGTGSATGVCGEILPITISYQGTKKVNNEPYGPINIPPTVPGEYQVTVSTIGDDNHNAGSATVTLTILAAPALVTAIKALNVRKDHNVHANVIAWLLHDEKIEVFDIWKNEKGDEIWVLHSPKQGWLVMEPGWSAMEYEGFTYVEFIKEGEESKAKTD